MEYVYVADFGDKVKIGYSTSVKNRIKQLESITKKKVKELYYEKAERPIETALHSYFSKFRITGEWFSVPFSDAKEILIDAIAHPEKYSVAEKGSSYRGFTEAQARAHKKYIARFVEVKVRMEPERREKIQTHAAARGESVNGFINRAIDEAMDRDKRAQEGSGGPPEDAGE